MTNYKKLFTTYLDSQGVKYSEAKDNVIRVPYTGDNLKTIPVFVFFDSDGEPLVCLKCWEIVRFDGEKMAKGINVCNELNRKFRWVKFYIDSDGDVNAQIDAYIDEESCGSTCKSLVSRMVNIVDEGYPAFMKALWS